MGDILNKERSSEQDSTRYRDLVSQLNEYLEIKRPSLDDLIHFVAARTLQPWSAERAFIARVDRDGVFREIAYFGFQFENSAGWAEVNIMDRVPMALAARSGARRTSSHRRDVRPSPPVARHGRAADDQPVAALCRRRRAGGRH